MCIIIFLRRVIYKILILVTSRLEKQRECDRGRVHGLKMHLVPHFLLFFENNIHSYDNASPL